MARTVDGEWEYLLVEARRSHAVWVLPKGHIEPGETPKTYDLHTDEDCQGARAKMRATREPVFWLGVLLLALGLGLIPLGAGPGRTGMAAVLATGAVLTAISAWAWWRTTETFMQFLRDFRKWAREK